MSEPIGRIVGIDLGTTYTSLAYLDRYGNAITVPNMEGEPLTPSVVLFEEDGAVVVGRDAKRAAFADPDLVASEFKREMGERFYSRVIAGERLSPVALSAMLLRKVIRDAEQRLGDIDGAVISVPAYFGDTRRKATEDAARIAGINVIDLINEPTAAALAAAFVEYTRRGGDPSDLVTARVAATAPATTLVFDLGGGTLDSTLIRINGNRFEVLACGGEALLGGIDWDKRLVDYASQQFIREHGVDPRPDAHAYQAVYNSCEEAKRTLSNRKKATIAVHYGGLMSRVQVTREKFEELSADLLARAEICMELLLQRAGLDWSEVDEVLPVGGSTRMPMIRDMLHRVFGKEMRTGLPADEAIAHGAAVHAAILFAQHSKHKKLAEIIPDLGDKEPSFEELTASLAALAQDTQTPVEEAQIVDVNAHSLGVAARSPKDNTLVNSIIIPKDTPLPAMRSKVFGLEEDDQRMVIVRIIEGEAADPAACTQIGQCVISQLPAGLPKGSPVEVVFRYDTRGRVHVKAVDRTSGVSAESTIRRDTAMTEGELMKLKDEVGRLVTD
jgi:molecular chaperone DnaK